MKKVLIIANLGGPSPRFSGLIKYLPQLGWLPIVISKNKPDNTFDINSQTTVTIVGTNNKKLRSSTLIAADNILKNEKIDAIITTSPPHINHVIAAELKNKYSTPWLADLRDLWTQNIDNKFNQLNWFKKILARRQELKTLALADCLTTVSQPWANQLKKLHHHKKIVTILNGFDSEQINYQPEKLPPKFTITYTGRTYNKKRTPYNFLAVLNKLIDRNIINKQNINVQFFGESSQNKQVIQDIQSLNLTDIVTLGGVISRNASFERQRQSHLLLLLCWKDHQVDGVKGNYPLKVFEYLAARRPIIAVDGPGDDELEKLIKETKSGYYCRTINDIETVITTTYQEHKNGRLFFNKAVEKIYPYNYFNMTKKFVDILNSITK